MSYEKCRNTNYETFDGFEKSDRCTETKRKNTTVNDMWMQLDATPSPRCTTVSRLWSQQQWTSWWNLTKVPPQATMPSQRTDPKANVTPLYNNQSVMHFRRWRPKPSAMVDSYNTQCERTGLGASSQGPLFCPNTGSLRVQVDFYMNSNVLK